ncbi:MAG TPA: enoyl-CoA hydratase-related protein [Ilumatobacteraceae bacterium]|nr:enoyl-CoA hydratase-related protein [Ilumatobacteraceae bacterium]
MADYTFLTYDVRDHVAHVEFGASGYAKSQEWELFDVLHRVNTDDDVHVMVLTSAGEKFGGGNHHEDDPFNGGNYYERAIKLFSTWMRVSKPIVVALSGPGSLTLALLSDIVVAERHVDIRDTHVVLGVPAATGAFLWPQSVGLAKAKRHLLVGDGIRAEEAVSMGLIAEVVDTGAGAARARELAAGIATLNPTGVQMSKRALNAWMEQNFNPILQHGLGLEFLHFPAGLFDGSATASKETTDGSEG